MKKLVSLLLSLCLLLSAVALAEESAVGAETVAQAVELKAEDVLATIGDENVTWGDTQSIYDSLVSSYGSYYDMTDAATIDLFRAVALENRLNELVLQKKIAEWELALTDEEAAQEESDAQSDWDNAIASYVSQMYSDLTDESAQEEKDAAREEAVAYYNGLGYSPESLKEQYRQYALYDKLQAMVVQDITVTDEEVEALYQDLVAADKELYENDPGAYEDYNRYVDQMASMYAMYGGYAGGMDYAWYRPAGFRAVKHILLPVDEELMNVYLDLQARFEEQTEAEESVEPAEENVYDKEAGNETAEEEEAEAEEPVTQAQVDEAKAAIFASLADKIDEINQKILDGADFDELIAVYGVNADGSASDPGMTAEPYKTSGYEVCADSASYVPEFVEAAFSVENVGDVSAPYLSDYGVHIVKYIADVPSGPVELTEAQREQKRDELLTSKQNEFYTSSVEEWTKAAGIVYTGLIPSYADLEAAEAQ